MRIIRVFMIKRIFLFQAILLSTTFTAYTMTTEYVFHLTEPERNIKGPPGSGKAYEYRLISDVFINYRTDTIAAWVNFIPRIAEDLIIGLTVIKNTITGNFEIFTDQQLKSSPFFWDFRCFRKKPYPEIEEILKRKISEFERNIKKSGSE